MSITNIERECAEFGFSLVDSVKDLVPVATISKQDRSKIIGIINKSLGILNSDGPFAFVIWLEYQGSISEGKKLEEKTAKSVHENSFSLLKKIGLVITGASYKALREELVKEKGICSNINQMFLVKGILEKMLTYALYNSKSLNVKDEDRQTSPNVEAANEAP